jgi:hypothetical protein
VIVSRGRQNFVAAAEHILSHCLRRHVRITGLGEVAVCRAANKSALALRVEPALRFAVGNDRSERRALSLISAIGAGSALLLLLLSSTATTTALSAASTLVASAPSIVSMIAIAVLPLVALLLSLTLSAATTTTAL